MSENITKLRGRDVAAPMNTITLGGKPYTLVYNNTTFRVAEDVYADCYGRPDKSFTDIAQDLARGKYGALMAILFGALKAGGASMPWAEFDAAFSLASLPEIQAALMQGVTDALPKPDGSEGDQGNA